MNNGLDALTEKRKRWVETNRENGFEDGIKRLLTELYPDNAHFVYELLQNAEDTRAEEVCFTLNNNELEFEHNGTRLFTFENVDSIASIGVSSKRDDPTSIGKFGVGFKAVFAYTNTPEIHSGDYHFRIHDLVVPEPVEQCQMGLRETKFVFPFNHLKKSARQANIEITKGLCDLGSNTLLFLKYIRKIEFLLPDGNLGSQERIEHEHGRIEIHTLHPDGKKQISYWLRFEQVVKVADEEGKPKDCRIAIAYSLTNSAKDDEPHAWKVTPLERGQVSIFFPAEKETSGLHFHVHAPFASTVARDSVRDCEANKILIGAIADLTANKLITLRDRGFLNITSYAALPMRAQDFPEGSLFRPMYDSVRAALLAHPLLPANGGVFKKAEEVKLARGKELVDLFSSNQLGLIFGKKELFWLDSSITESVATVNFHNYLCDEIEGVEVLPESLEPKLTAQFMRGQSICWLIKFIQYAMQGSRSLKRVPFIRLQSGDHVILPRISKSQSTAWFAPKRTDGLDLTNFPLVHKELAANKEIKEFLEKENIRPIDSVAIIIECILPQYNVAPLVFDEHQYRSHLKQINEAYSEAGTSKAKSQLTNSLNDVAWLACVHASGKNPNVITWKKPTEPLETWWGCCAQEKELASLFVKTDDMDCWFNGLDSVEAYFPHSSVVDELKDNFLHLTKSISVLTQRLCDAEGKIIILSDIHNHYRGVDGFSPYATVIGLHVAFENWNIERTHILWNILLSAPRIISGETQSESNKLRLDAAPKLHEFTEVGKFCIDQNWLFDRGGSCHKPRELFLIDLPENFDISSVFAKEVAQKLGMKQPMDLMPLAKAYGKTPEEIARRLSVTPEELEDIELKRNARLCSPVLPNRKFTEKRALKVAEYASNSPEILREMKVRTIDPDFTEAQNNSRSYLKGQYKNEDEIMFCQICNAQQPVMLNGEPYFEVVTCVAEINSHHEQNNLALCPNHAAMYKNGGLNPDTIKRAILECKGQKIPLNLASNDVRLYFTEQHIGDLRVVLSERNFKKI